MIRAAWHPLAKRELFEFQDYRNKIGLDIAMEALKDSIERKQDTFDNLWKFAKVCRVANVTRPYLESFG